MTKKELEKQFQDLRHIVLNYILVQKALIKEMENSCIKAESAIKELGSNIEVNNNDNNKT